MKPNKKMATEMSEESQKKIQDRIAALGMINPSFVNNTLSGLRFLDVSFA